MKAVPRSFHTCSSCCTSFV